VRIERPRSFRTVCLALALAGAAGPAIVGCTSAYYSAMEQVGQHKRDILKSRIESGREEQQEAQEQFKTTYQRFKEVASHDGGDLEATYDRLNSAYEDSEARAQDVRDRIASIEQVSADLFAEWQTEIDSMQSANLKSQSSRSLKDTRAKYAKLIGAMKKAEGKMPPVLTAFRDQVLFLKHNLNARAIASLSGSLGEIQGDVDALIRDIDASIQESERFLATLESAS
jgi:ABC-type transporter Mla subunit MlaD